SPLCRFVSFFSYCYARRRNVLSFPTRRSSDLSRLDRLSSPVGSVEVFSTVFSFPEDVLEASSFLPHPVIMTDESSKVNKVNVNLDRKSTRLNSSHVKISYAVFCLKKKKKKKVN